MGIRAHARPYSRAAPLTPLICRHSEHSLSRRTCRASKERRAPWRERMIEAQPGGQRSLTGLLALYRSTIGMKVVMAVTGFILYGFVLVHMWGNLKIYMGREYFNNYSGFLREVGGPFLGHEQALWLIRIVLIVSVA